MDPKGKTTLSGLTRGKSIRLTVICHLLVYICAQMTACVSGDFTSCIAYEESGDMARVRCSYPLDLNLTKQSFCVLRYEDNGGRTDVVTTCSWNDINLRCVFEEDFRLVSQTISDEFLVEMPVKRAMGTFSCDTIPPDMTMKVETCALTATVADSKITGSLTPSRFGSHFNATNATEATEMCQTDGANFMGWFAASSVLNVVLLLVLILPKIYQKHRSRALGGTPDKNKGDVASTQPPLLSHDGGKPRPVGYGSCLSYQVTEI